MISIEFVTDDDELRIEIYNRGNALLASHDDRMTRLHRICVALDRAAKSGSGTTFVAGRLGRTRARLLARNESPVWPCRVCGEAATVICPSCKFDGVNPFACDAHADRDLCGQDAALLPAVNSPRVGTCAYGEDLDFET